MKKFSWFLGVVLAVALTVGLTSGPAAAYRPETGATFNVPKPWGREKANYKIVASLENAIRHTRPTRRHPHPSIHISTFLMDRSVSARALVRACRRGVSVRVIMDEEIASRPSKRVMRVLNADNVRDRNRDGRADRPAKRGACDSDLPTKAEKKRQKQRQEQREKRQDRKDDRRKHDKKSDRAKHEKKRVSRKARNNPGRPAVTWGADRSYAKKCQGSCRGVGGNMHSKFFLFSKTGKSRKVVMVGSSNLNRGGGTLGWNDLYTIVDRNKSYNEYVRIHRLMTNDDKAGGRQVEIKDGPYRSRFFPMRHANKHNDPTMIDLRGVTCRVGKGKRAERTAINVSMFFWKGPRGNYIASRLLDLAREGCRVSIIYGAPSLQIAERLRDAARARRINLYDSRWDMNGDGLNEVRMHSKYILIKGTVGRDRDAVRVITGSQNWVQGSLSKGDETTLSISRNRAYRQYIKHWNRVKAHSRRLPYHW